MAGGKEPEKQDDPMTGNSSTKKAELKLNPPKDFTGKREEFDRFIQDVTLHLEINKHIYDTDTNRIGYALSFMKEGEADSWKGQFLTKVKTTSDYDFGTWEQFQTDLTKVFKPYDAPGEALEKITTLKMGTNSIEDHIAKYRVLLSKAGIDVTQPTAIDYFQKSLPVPLQKELMRLPTPPKDLKEWYEWAMRLDSNYRKLLRAFGKKPEGKAEPRKTWHFQKREKDPNTMDVDALTLEKRNEMMRKGLCFNCEKQGHLSRDCPDKKKASTSQKNSPLSYSPPKKPPPKELGAYIRAITAEYNDEERSTFYDDAEKEGF
jgi:Ty3 transposon capsid-like protein/Zinc knuckle